jgi:hypothetical protein
MLEAIRQPSDLRRLSGDQLTELAAEIRDFLVRAVAIQTTHTLPRRWPGSDPPVRFDREPDTTRRTAVTRQAADDPLRTGPPMNACMGRRLRNKGVATRHAVQIR